MQERAACGRHWIWVAVVFLYAGCLPSSCQRIESRAVSPEDSLSRQIASGIIPDTIQSVQVLTGEGESMLEWPRTVLFDAAGRIYVSDTGRHTLFVFDTDGALVEEFAWERARFPYLAGWRGDSLLVFNPTHHKIDILLDTELVDSIPTPPPDPRSLQYALATPTTLYLKVVSQTTDHTIWQLDRKGAIVARAPLSGSPWDHAGLLRANGEVPVSLTGFFPRIMTWPHGLTEAPITFRWQGFDSPMLRRTFAFDQGSARNIPLLSSAAALAGTHWFVINLRPGWLRLDLYDHSGRLQHVLIEEDPAYAKEFYPTDIAVRQRSPNAFDIAVTMVTTEPAVRRYVWQSD